MLKNLFLFCAFAAASVCAAQTRYFMQGENDKNAPLDTVISAYKMIPNASLAVIASAPHQAFMANFDAVWANVKQFLEE